MALLLYPDTHTRRVALPLHASTYDYSLYTNHGMLLAQPGPLFNGQRKVFRKVLGPQAVPSYDGLVEQNISGFLAELSKYSGNPYPIIVE